MPLSNTLLSTIPEDLVNVITSRYADETILHMLRKLGVVSEDTFQQKIQKHHLSHALRFLKKYFGNFDHYVIIWYINQSHGDSDDEILDRLVDAVISSHTIDAQRFWVTFTSMQLLEYKEDEEISPAIKLANYIRILSLLLPKLPPEMFMAFMPIVIGAMDDSIVHIKKVDRVKLSVKRLMEVIFVHQPFVDDVVGVCGKEELFDLALTTAVKANNVLNATLLVTGRLHLKRPFEFGFVARIRMLASESKTKSNFGRILKLMTKNAFLIRTNGPLEACINNVMELISRTNDFSFVTESSIEHEQKVDILLNVIKKFGYGNTEWAHEMLEWLTDNAPITKTASSDIICVVLHLKNSDRHSCLLARLYFSFLTRTFGDRIIGECGLKTFTSIITSENYDVRSDAVIDALMNERTGKLAEKLQALVLVQPENVVGKSKMLLKKAKFSSLVYSNEALSAKIGITFLMKHFSVDGILVEAMKCPFIDVSHCAGELLQKCVVTARRDLFDVLIDRYPAAISVKLLSKYQAMLEICDAAYDES